MLFETSTVAEVPLEVFGVAAVAALPPPPHAPVRPLVVPGATHWPLVLSGVTDRLGALRLLSGGHDRRDDESNPHASEQAGYAVSQPPRR